MAFSTKTLQLGLVAFLLAIGLGNSNGHLLLDEDLRELEGQMSMSMSMSHGASDTGAAPPADSSRPPVDLSGADFGKYDITANPDGTSYTVVNTETNETKTIDESSKGLDEFVHGMLGITGIVIALCSSGSVSIASVQTFCDAVGYAVTN